MLRFISPLLCLFIVACSGTTSTTQNDPTDATVTADNRIDRTLQTDPVPVDGTLLDGTWILVHVAGTNQPLDSLYSTRKPEMTLDATYQTVVGSSGCNAINGKFNRDENRITFIQPFTMTKMLCSGDGERVFLDKLKTVNNYSIIGRELRLLSDNDTVMLFEKQ